jgi:hypothetical protein
MDLRAWLAVAVLTQTVVVRTQPLEDLNSDGVADRWVARTPCGATGNCDGHLELGLPDGGFAFAGIAEGTGVVVLPTRHHHVRDLRAWWGLGCAGREGALTELWFDGTIYRPQKITRCHCDDAPDAGICDR